MGCWASARRNKSPWPCSRGTEVYESMKVECPMKDWQGEQSLLPIHLQEMHKITVEGAPNQKPGVIGQKMTFQQWLLKFAKEHPQVVAYLGFFILGTLYGLWAAGKL